MDACQKPGLGTGTGGRQDKNGERGGGRSLLNRPFVRSNSSDNF